MKRIFVDMDGVLADFGKYMETTGMSADTIKVTKNTYREMEPIPGSIESVRELLRNGWDVWVATKPPTGVASAYMEKAEWIFKHLPELKRKLIITADKGLLGDTGDYLIDDRPHKGNCHEFPGSLITFRHPSDWKLIVELFRKKKVAETKLVSV